MPISPMAALASACTPLKAWSFLWFIVRKHIAARNGLFTFPGQSTKTFSVWVRVSLQMVIFSLIIAQGILILKICNYILTEDVNIVQVRTSRSYPLSTHPCLQPAPLMVKYPFYIWYLVFHMPRSLSMPVLHQSIIQLCSLLRLIFVKTKQNKNTEGLSRDLYNFL